jgi:hypothetical protein
MGTIPDRKYPFSDHEGVAAIFSINQNAKCKYFLVVLKRQTEEGESSTVAPPHLIRPFFNCKREGLLHISPLMSPLCNHPLCFLSVVHWTPI